MTFNHLDYLCTSRCVAECLCWAVVCMKISQRWKVARMVQRVESLQHSEVKTRKGQIAKRHQLRAVIQPSQRQVVSDTQENHPTDQRGTDREGMHWTPASASLPCPTVQNKIGSPLHWQPGSCTSHQQPPYHPTGSQNDQGRESTVPFSLVSNIRDSHHSSA